jgi:pimeloyl-ACP methyl ester carboxylesterase
MEKICFNNSHGQKIRGILSGTNPDTVVLICHGLGGSKDVDKYVMFAARIDALGLSTFRIDLLGHGESDGEYDDLTLTEAIDDIIRAKKELHDRGYKNVGFIGHSFGGVGGIMAASREQFKFLILISPPTYYDISEMVSSGIYLLRRLRKHNKTVKNKKKAHLHIKFFKDYGSHDSYAAAEKINAPTLIIHGDEDKIVPIVKSRELRKHIKGSKIKIFKGACHNYKKPQAQRQLIKEVTKFVEENK